MDLNLNIELGSISDNLSKTLEKFNVDTLVNETLNINQLLSSVVNLSSSKELVDKILDASTITSILGENGPINTIKSGMQITEKITEAAKSGLDYATSALTVLNNTQKLLMSLNKMQDVDVMCIPTVKDSASVISSSAIDQITAQYEILKQQLLLFYNSMICTSNDSTIDNVVKSASNILNTIEPMIDPILQQYTGHTISEVRNICNLGFGYVGMIERAAANKRKSSEE